MAESPRIIELQQKFEDNPRRYFASLANEYRKAGDFQRAMSICRIYLEKQPTHMAGHVVLGQALHALGKLDEAEETFRTVLTLDPENLTALKCLGDIAQSRGNLEQAHDNFRRVLTADPRDHETNARLKTVEQALKLAASKPTEDWIPPRTSDEFLIPDGGPNSSPAESDSVAEGPVDSSNQAEFAGEISEPAGPIAADPRQLAEAAADEEQYPSLEIQNLPPLEAAAIHEDVPEDDFVDTLLPETSGEHHPSIAEPVAQESAEDSLAVPDLLEEAGEIQSPYGGDEFQYRTAEFSLPSIEASDLETAETSSEVESESQAFLEDAAPIAEPRAEQPEFDRAMRTGEYSLAHDTAEWNRESGERADIVDAAEEESVDDVGVEPAGPFITETVAELYLQQGFTGEALLVYRQLARAKPNDQRIAERIAALEDRLADEHAARQAKLDLPVHEPEAEPEIAPEAETYLDAQPVYSPPEAIPAFEKPRKLEIEDFDRAWAPPPPAEVPSPDDDWFSVPDIAPVRSRQTVHEFFAVLGRAKPEIRRKAAHTRVSADEIRAAADITAGFGAFGIEPKPTTPKPIPQSVSGEQDSQDDVRRFRSWLDGLSDS
jgi:tetratricopeptide (TPR) repeat protein